RLFDPDEGTVAVDGHDIREVALDDLRRHVVLVDQEPFVFHASVAENIRYARPDASDEEVRDAARAAGLDAFIARLPDGYATVVGERGAALSAGAPQPNANARPPPINPHVPVPGGPSASLDPGVDPPDAARFGPRMRA